MEVIIGRRGELTLTLRGGARPSRGEGGRCGKLEWELDGAAEQTDAGFFGRELYGSVHIAVVMRALACILWAAALRITAAEFFRIVPLLRRGKRAMKVKLNNYYSH